MQKELMKAIETSKKFLPSGAPKSLQKTATHKDPFREIKPTSSSRQRPVSTQTRPQTVASGKTSLYFQRSASRIDANNRPQTVPSRMSTAFYQDSNPSRGVSAANREKLSPVQRRKIPLDLQQELRPLSGRENLPYINVYIP